MTIDREALVAKAKAERRRYVRVPVNLAGRLFVPGDGSETRCRVVDMSPGGAQIVSDITRPSGTQVILYIDGFGRFEGEVARPEQDRFSVRFHCSPLKRERVAEQLTVLINRGAVDETAQRRHERLTNSSFAHFTRSNGENIPCQVLDLSLTGVELKAGTKPRIGEVVMIGQMSGRVVRHHPSGIAVEFTSAAAEKPERRQLLRKRQ
jgi:PilZ domain